MALPILYAKASWKEAIWPSTDAYFSYLFRFAVLKSTLFGGILIMSFSWILQQISTPKEAFRKTWSAKYTLRSHFDGVRALGFHPTEPVLITASEDQTLKLWNLQKTVPAKKSAALDVEPVYTFRAHTGPVLSLTIASNGDLCFSGGIDSTIRVWNLPSPSVDPYDCFGKFFL